MTEEPRKLENGERLTTPNLYDYIKMRFDENDAFVQMRFHEHEKLHAEIARAIGVATTTMEKRLDGMNEFRAALADQAQHQLTRELYDSEHQNLVVRVSNLEQWRARAAGAAVVLMLFAGGIGALIAHLVMS